MAKPKAPQRDYAKLLKTKPPEDLLAYMISKGAFDEHYLIYRADWWTDPLTDQKEKVVRVTCSHCGESFLADYIPAGCCSHCWAPAPFGFFAPPVGDEPGAETISGQTRHCPCCGHKATAVHIGNMPAGIENSAYCMTVDRLEDKLVLYGWRVRRWIDKAGVSSFDQCPYEAYVVEDRKLVRLAAHRRVISSDVQNGKWEQRKAMMDKWGAGMWMPWDPKILEGSTAENSALDIYMGSQYGEYCFPVTYLRVWKKHPTAENLLRQGADRILCEAINRDMKYNTNYYGEMIGSMPKLEAINWKDRRPAQMLRLNKNEFRHCVAQRWSFDDWYTYKYVTDLGHRLELPQDMELLCSFGNITAFAERVAGIYQLSRCLRYLKKQYDRTQDKCLTAGFYGDYLNLAELDHQDIRDPHVAFPRNLRRAHDDLAYLKDKEAARKYAEQNRKAIDGRRNAFHNRAMELEPYAWEHQGLTIAPVPNEETLIDESAQLSHCVRTYAQRIADGKTAIFLIRHKESPTRAYYTLELDTEKLEVLQNRGKCNCERTPEVREFEKLWLAWLRTTRPMDKKEVKTA